MGNLVGKGTKWPGLLGQGHERMVRTADAAADDGQPHINRSGTF